jgi:hypothetical protein
VCIQQVRLVGTGSVSLAATNDGRMKLVDHARPRARPPREPAKGKQEGRHGRHSRERVEKPRPAFQHPEPPRADLPAAPKST